MRLTRQRPRGWQPLLELLEDRLVPATYTVNSTGDTGGGSGLAGDLRYCLTQADANPGSTIVFDATAFATAQTITLSGALPDLSQSMQIDGPAAGVTVNAAGHSRVLTIDSGATVTVSNLTITGGSATDQGGGIDNSGALTLTNCTLSGNSAYDGGGIINRGTLTLSGATLSHNYAPFGGGIDNGGSLTLTDCTLAGNTASFGGGIENAGTVTLTDCTLSGNSAETFGGGLSNDLRSTATLSNCTVSGNTADQGGGLGNGGLLTLSNCTVSGNSAVDSAADFGGAVLGGAGLYNGGAATLNNTIVAGNFAAGDASDVTGTVTARYSLIQGLAATAFTADSGHNITGRDPLLAPLGNYGGPTQTYALLPGSLALDAGSVALAVDQNGQPLATDQRGLPRVTHGAVDIGAFEFQGDIVVNSTVDTNTRDNVLTLREALLFLTGGLKLSDLTPAEQQQASIDPGEPVITFDPTVFATSQTITLVGTALPEIAKGVLITGPAAGVTVNAAGHSRVLTIDAGATVRISNLTITGGSANGQGGGIDNAGTLTLSNCTVSGNFASQEGGGIDNSGTLTMSVCTISGNTAILNSTSSQGGGIDNSGTLTMSICTLRDNSAYEGGGLFNSGTATLTDNCKLGLNNAPIGGGIDNVGGSLALTDCTLAGNTASFGGGLHNLGTVTLTDCTVSGNSAETVGGGLVNDGTATLSNCTISGNTADQGGGLINGGPLTLSNCTVSGNTVGFSGAARVGAGLYTDGGVPTLSNTIVAGNFAAGVGSDVNGLVTAQFSLIQSLAGITFTADSGHNITGQDPLLAPLGFYGGDTQTMPLLPGSPAINAGTSTGAPAADQRGRDRLGAVDIGAFESQGFDFSVVFGPNQSAPVGTAFPTALAVVVASYVGEPVQGGVVTFTAPTGGASATFAGGRASATATIDATAIATPPFLIGYATAPALIANDTAGSYTVTADAAGAGAGTPATFSLTNTLPPPPPPPPQPPPTPPGLDANGRFVYHLYQDLLGRQPGQSEVSFCGAALDQGTLTQAQVAAFFANSVEYHQHQVDQLYERLLGRHVDAATAALFAAGGGNLEQIEAVILGSDEYSQRHGGTAAGFLAGLGQDVLGGNLDAADLSLLQAELATGTPRYAVALQALAEPQAAVAEAGRLYQQVLRRSASGSELLLPAVLILQGDETALLLALLLSDEFANLP